jgi:hypothetical protein
VALAFINRDQNTVTATPTTTAATAGITHTAGNLLVAFAFFANNTGASSVTLSDTAGNSYTGVGSPYIGLANSVSQLFYAKNCLGNASNVVTSTLNAGNSAYMALSVRQFSGAETGTVLEASPASASGTGTAIDSGSVTVTAASAIIMAGIFAVTNAGFAPGSGYTLDAFAADPAAGEFFADEYKIVTASEAATATITAAQWEIVAAAFKIASSPPPPPPPSPPSGGIFQCTTIG